MTTIPSGQKTGKIVIEAELDLLEALIAAIEPVLVITYMSSNNRLHLNPDKVRRTLRAHPKGEDRGAHY